jgi:hypothetical protein
VFVLCFVKYFAISLVQGGITFYRPDFRVINESTTLDLHLSLLFGMLCFGNIIDNTQNTKYLAVCCQLGLGITWLLSGFQERSWLAGSQIPSLLYFYQR